MLGQEESCTGDPARRMGNEYVYQMLATGNVETLNRYKPKTIVTACPHCFNTIGNEYGQFGGHVRGGAPLARSWRGSWRRAGSTASTRGRERARSPTTTRATWRATTASSREPRAVLGAVPGMELREMEQHGRRRFCCGAGGGRMWMEEKRGTRINAERTRQALDTGADGVATACPVLPGDDARRRRRGPGDGARPCRPRTSRRRWSASLSADRFNGRQLPVVQA